MLDKDKIKSWNRLVTCVWFSETQIDHRSIFTWSTFLIWERLVRLHCDAVRRTLVIPRSSKHQSVVRKTGQQTNARRQEIYKVFMMPCEVGRKTCTGIARGCVTGGFRGGSRRSRREMCERTVFARNRYELLSADEFSAWSRNWLGRWSWSPKQPRRPTLYVLPATFETMGIQICLQAVIITYHRNIYPNTMGRPRRTMKPFRPFGRNRAW